MHGHMRFATELRAVGKMMVGERLRLDGDATRVRVKAGQRAMAESFARNLTICRAPWIQAVAEGRQRVADYVGDGAQGRGDRCQRSFVLAILSSTSHPRRRGERPWRQGRRSTADRH